MSDLFAVDMALDLNPDVPDVVLDTLRWHLGLGEAEEAGEFPLLAQRGPAARIGGVLTGELLRRGHHWVLTARQEIHAEFLPELGPLWRMLAANAQNDGVIGHMRFLEDEVPEVLISRAGRLIRMGMRAAGEQAE